MLVRLKGMTTTDTYWSGHSYRLMSSDKPNTVYCDGSCLRNGRSDAVAGIGVYWSLDSKYNISETLKLPSRPTNNMAELIAIIRAVQSAIEQGMSSVQVVTDSRYSVLSLNADLTSPKKIPNRELIAELQEICSHKDIKVSLMLVKGHDDCEGNKMADKLATDAAKRG
ncbi:ribonuclease H1-like isoform X2 [Dysidea avara]